MRRSNYDVKHITSVILSWMTVMTMSIMFIMIKLLWSKSNIFATFLQLVTKIF